MIKLTSILHKLALHTEFSQKPEVVQVGRSPSAVIVKGNPKFITNNPLANKFYNTIADYLRQKNHSVTFDKGEPYTQPANADLWIGHSRGIDRLRFAPKGTKTLDLSQYEHPVAKAFNAKYVPGQDILPPPHHYFFTKEMRQAIDKLINEKTR